MNYDLKIREFLALNPNSVYENLNQIKNIKDHHPDFIFIRKEDISAFRRGDYHLEFYCRLIISIPEEKGVSALQWWYEKIKNFFFSR